MIRTYLAKPRNVAYAVCLLTAIILMMWGFVTPPTGVIDVSVLKGVILLLAFASLPILQSIIHERSITLRHGDTEIHVHDNDDDDDERDETADD